MRYIKVQFIKPASLQNELLSDTAKDGKEQQVGFQAGDMTIGAGGGT